MENALQIITTMRQLDEKLLEANEAGKRSDAALRDVFTGFAMDLEAVTAGLPPDPFSEQYYRFQMDLYAKIAGREYAETNEVSTFDVKSMVRRPFPLSSGSTSVVGMHYSALGFVLSHLSLPPNARILEFGPGWGNTTITLAALGYQVTAVDIEPNFCELLNERAALNQVNIDVKCADFFFCEQTQEPFDAVIFYECFHHCADHMRLLRGLHRALKPQGRVFLGAEPIQSNFPIPWGVRLDGESLWAIRRNGWMELGFDHAYFLEALRRTGWTATVRASQDVGWANLWELEQHFDHSVSIDAADPRVETQVGLRSGRSVSASSAGPGYLLYGLRVTLAAGSWVGHVQMTPGFERTGHVVIDVCSEFGHTIHASRDCDLATVELDDANSLQVAFSLGATCSNLELRLFCRESVSASIDGINFSPTDPGSKQG